jgi:hypothetical protein
MAFLVMTGHINVMLVLQSCTDPLRILPSSSIETLPTTSDGTYDVGNVKLEGDIEVIEECFIAINKDEDIGIKQVEIPEDITSPDIKPDPHEVSYVCVCMLLDTFYHCPDVNISVQLKWLQCRE